VLPSAICMSPTTERHKAAGVFINQSLVPDLAFSIAHVDGTRQICNKAASDLEKETCTERRPVTPVDEWPQLSHNNSKR
jgi:hypothetical protein